MTYKEAANLYQFLNGWNDALNANLAYKLALTKNILTEPLKQYSLMLNNIQNEYQTETQMSPARKIEYEEKVSQIWNSTIEVNIPTITIQDLGDIQFCIASMTALLPIIKQE